MFDIPLATLKHWRKNKEAIMQADPLKSHAKSSEHRGARDKELDETLRDVVQKAIRANHCVTYSSINYYKAGIKCNH